MNSRRALIPLLAVTLMSACTETGGDGPAESSTTPTEAPATTTTAAPTTTTSAAPVTTTGDDAGHETGTDSVDPAQIAAANLATAAFQDVAMAEAAGYASSLETLGCFEDADLGGMGLHYLNESLMDDVVDVSAPEALVYELTADGR